MTISQGDTLPGATLIAPTAEGPAPVALADKLAGRKVVIFGLPGAYTGVCSTAHVPSFIAAMDDLKAKGVDEVICVSVNDPFVMGAWSKDTGAGEAGITMLCDPESAFTTAIGLDFSAPPAGLINRSKRYAMAVEDGKVTVLHLEESPGTCDISGGKSMVAAL
ncbi:peroxiredoxin [Maritimibacter alkaliphilus]|uniref:peroxiredoxin n=1 Tax=Maritimibacter alkaliphilus TaxID=404236 RepID=UPI001C9412C9|nr:peroxiredoxin [Maritimibacter alkaliphilus]MBY6090688.1 peroxiredoxin [Maritimibacter alkaliphilus]